MNKSFKPLAEKALDHAVPYTWHSLDHGEIQKVLEKFADLIEAHLAQKTIQAHMTDPAFVQAMDEYYENKWAHRFG